MTDILEHTRPDDYDPDAAEWIDVTTVCSSFQIEMDVTRAGHYRHRNPRALGPWVRGLPKETDQ